MKVNSIFLLLTFSLVVFFSFLIFKLNQSEVLLDILFSDIKVRLGVLILGSFLAGLLSCLIFEFIYFYKKNKDWRTTMKSPIIIALDMGPEVAIELAEKIDPTDCKVKVGSQLFTTGGPAVIEKLKDFLLGLKI